MTDHADCVLFDLLCKKCPECDKDCPVAQHRIPELMARWLNKVDMEREWRELTEDIFDWS